MGKLKKIWADPVWSKGIYDVFKWVWPLIVAGLGSYFAGWWPNLGAFFQQIVLFVLSSNNIPNWLLIVGGFIVLWKFVEIVRWLVYPSLKFDVDTGTWVGRKTGLRYCTGCKANKISSPLRNESRGWSCPVCARYFSDPARKYIEPALPDLGPNSWMVR